MKHKEEQQQLVEVDYSLCKRELTFVPIKDVASIGHRANFYYLKQVTDPIVFNIIFAGKYRQWKSIDRSLPPIDAANVFSSLLFK